MHWGSGADGIRIRGYMVYIVCVCMPMPMPCTDMGYVMNSLARIPRNFFWLTHFNNIQKQQVPSPTSPYPIFHIPWPICPRSMDHIPIRIPTPIPIPFPFPFLSNWPTLCSSQIARRTQLAYCCHIVAPKTHRKRHSGAELIATFWNYRKLILKGATTIIF